MTSAHAFATSMLMHSLWQDTLIAGAFGLVVIIARSPKVRYVAGCVALTAMVLLPVSTARLADVLPGAPGPAPAAIAGTGSATSPMIGTTLAKVETTTPRLADVLRWLPFLWLAGVCACSLRFIAGGLKVSSLRRDTSPADPMIQAVVAGLARRMGVRRELTITSTATIGPATIGWLRPLILLPPSIIAGLTPQQLEGILAHELAHIRRHDYLVNVLQMVVEALFFYHPAIWWVSSQVRADREACCDDEAVAVCSNREELARALVALARTLAVPPSMTLPASRHSLVWRVRRLLDSETDGPSPLTVASVATALLTTSLLASSWTYAQPQTVAKLSGEIGGTVYDPSGQPAEHTVLVLAGDASDSTVQVRTDETGRFRASGLPPGRYAVVTPATDVVVPATIDVSAGPTPHVDFHLGVENVAIDLNICRDCRPETERPVATLVAGRAELSNVIVDRAEPAEGWNAFNRRTWGYPKALQTLGLEGTVVLTGVIASDGSTADLMVVSSPDTRLSDVALEYIAGLRWRPAGVRGRPAGVALHATVEFTRRGIGFRR